MKLNLLFIFSLYICCCLCEHLNKYEGSKCTWKGVNGTCVNMYQCESAPFYLKEKDYPPICTFQGKDPVICCTDCDTVDDTRDIIFNPNVGLLYLTGSRANDECVRYIDKLDYDCKQGGNPIVYSRNLDEESNCYTLSDNSTTFFFPEPGYPYMALLGYGQDIEKAEWTCAGSIISDKFILTAAQCITNILLGPVKYIAVGIENRTDSPKNWQTYKVKRAIPYPEYEPPSKYHDIALVETEIPIVFNEKVLPGCLDIGNSYTDNAVVVIYSEIGSYFTNGISGFYPDTCSFFYPPQETMVDGFNVTTQDCYGNKNPGDHCRSDLGSALIGQLREANCAQLLIGVTSIQRICGTAASSGLYTRVVFYVPWIESIVWPS